MRFGTDSQNLLTLIEGRGFVFNPAILRSGLHEIIHILMDIELSQLLKASLYERNSKRRAYRNGYRESLWQTSVGAIQIRIPKLRRGTYYPDQLLNDQTVITSLIRLIKLSILIGVDEQILRHDLVETIDLQFSNYDISQIADAIAQVIEDAMPEDEVELDIVSLAEIDWLKRRYILLMSKSQYNGLQEIVRAETTSHLDQEFWQDFTRRMQQSGLITEAHHLSQINPYAIVQPVVSHLTFHSRFVEHINHEYEQILSQLLATV